jgi:glycosyltransferase involved in cell wall biosynthesis
VRHPGAKPTLQARDGTAPLRVLTVTRLFPNRLEPFACAFQRQQLVSLSRRCHVEVVAGIPYLAGAALLGGRTRAARLRGLPLHDEIDGIPVLHARVPYVPCAGDVPLLAALNGPLYLAGLLPHLPSLRGRFDVVLGTFLYPDACAAAALARVLGLPLVVKAHGTDVNVVARWPLIQPAIAAALRSARFAAGVSRAMVSELIRLGAPGSRAVLLQNGVDRALFRPSNRAEARRALGLPQTDRIVLYVGGLEKEKGLGELTAAFARLRETDPRVHLVLVGGGSFGPELRAAEGALSAAQRRVILAGEQSLPAVARYLAACDVLALPSWAEGMPNVILEALAAGRPVVASRVGGVPDVIVDGRTGLLIPPRDAEELFHALRLALARTWDEATLVAAAPPSWDESADRLYGLLAEAAGRPESRRPRAAGRYN